MTIAITGGAGFIGTALARELQKAGKDFIILDLHESAAFLQQSRIVDVADREALTRALEGVDTIYHLAAEHRDDVRPVERYYMVNAGGADNVVAAAKYHSIRKIIFTSTVAVYGLNAGDSQESDVPRPFNEYGHSKRHSEKIFETWAANDPRNTLVTIRLVATFGPGNRGNIHTLMDQIARGKFMMVGGGKNHKSIAYIGNVAAFLQHALSMPAGAHLYNYADKPDLATRDLVHTIRSALGLRGETPQIPFALGLMGGMAFDAAAKLTGKRFPISVIRVRKFCADTIVNADKLHETGFAPPFTLEEGLREMIAAEFPQAAKAA